MSRIVDEVLRLPLGTETIAGRLYADNQGWSFSSTDAAFLEIFPKGAVLSFRDYGIGAAAKHARNFKMLIEKELQKMTS
jgi:hypothetical protein